MTAAAVAASAHGARMFVAGSRSSGSLPVGTWSGSRCSRSPRWQPARSPWQASGLVSVIEVGASTVVLWQLSSAGVACRYAHNRSPAGPRRVSSKVYPCCTIAQINSFHESTPSHPDPLTEASPGDSVRWPRWTLPEAPCKYAKAAPKP